MKKARSKRSYEPPKVTRVPLAASEVSFMGCKLGSPTGSRAQRCNATSPGCVNTSAGS